MYIISILISKFTNFVIKLLKLGSGNTWPGNVVIDIYPNILNKINSKLPPFVVFVSGTNGKTTTVKLIKHILESQGHRVLSNDTGANLVNGVVSSILLNSNFSGSLPYDAAVFELDELNLSKIMESINPDVLALLNLSRDQLDRYWEKDIVLENWLKSVKKMSTDSTLILDKDQNEFKKIAEAFKGSIIYFDNDKSLLKNTSLLGDFNAKNVNCAVLAANEFGIDESISNQSLNDFSSAYGRGEHINYKDKHFQVFLAKNPESLNQNLNLLIENKVEYDSLLYILNDNIPDGRDISWIYDVDPKLLYKASKDKKIFVTGSRFLDMSVRLHYADVKISNELISISQQETIEKIIEDSDVKNIVVLPNYSAMLQFRKKVVGRKIL